LALLKRLKTREKARRPDSKTIELHEIILRTQITLISEGLFAGHHATDTRRAKPKDLLLFWFVM